MTENKTKLCNLSSFDLGTNLYTVIHFLPGCAPGPATPPIEVTPAMEEWGGKCRGPPGPPAVPEAPAMMDKFLGIC